MSILKINWKRIMGSSLYKIEIELIDENLKDCVGVLIFDPQHFIVYNGNEYELKKKRINN